ncbi:translation elongation factor Ts [Parvularcula marina]|uniref:Elongation factor Ts n=1 Tax=Parvularcula marina TaxID=2292771 RepID=A0A371RJR8_9PROT|nr:translation elongation factor Ts [Parvularcula marina]RFB05693.1 elongation factor Ts [Parvularcula marina]
MAITAQMVKELREKTGAGMMDSKKALQENDGDIEAAVDWLRKKGLAKAAKKAGRAASEGLVAYALDGTKGAVVEVNSETDFVARNELFQKMVAEIAQVALSTDGSVEAVKAAQFPGAGKSVEEHVNEMVGQIGENMSVRRAASLSVEHGVVVPYVHTPIGEQAGKIVVLVALKSVGDSQALLPVGKQVAMHIAAARPLALTVADLDQDVVAREKNVLADQARASGKPDNIIEKMVEGRMQKFYEESVLLEQIFVIDGETRIKDVVANAKAEAGAEVTLDGFIRLELGEGVEKEEEDFAAEVAAMNKG